MKKILYFLLLLSLKASAQRIYTLNYDTVKITGSLNIAKDLKFGGVLPSLIPGTNVTITGTWPNQTINSTGGGGGSVTSVFGRTGVITAQSGDYSGFYPLLTGSYTNPSWIVSIPWSKITATPTTLSGYGITDAYAFSGSTSQLTRGDGTYITNSSDNITEGATNLYYTTAMALLKANVSGQVFTGAISATNLSGTNTGDQTTITGNAGSATVLQTGRTIGITGDLVYTSPSFNGSSNVTAAGTLATVNANVGSFGSSTSIPSFTVNAKGLITSASGNVVIAPGGTLTGTTLASNVVTSSLISAAGGTFGTNAFNSTAYVPQTTTINGKALSSNIILGLASSDFANQGTTTTVLHGNPAGNPSFSALSLSADVTGNLPVTNLNSGTNASGTTFWSGDGTWATPTASVAWGSITGTLSSQTDLNTALGLKAPLASPVFTGTPSLPTGTTGITQSPLDNSTKLATTAYTDAAVATVTPVYFSSSYFNGAGTLASPYGIIYDSTPTSSSLFGVTSGGVFTAEALKAPIASPTFTGTVTLPVISIGLANKIGVVEGTGGRVGQVALVAGTKAITITGLTTSSRAFCQRVTSAGTTLTIEYNAVCTSNTLTITADLAAGTINTADTSTLNYVIFN